MTLKTKAASGAKWNAVSSFVTIGSQILKLTILARLLAPEEFGLMAIVLLIIGFAKAYADAGISGAIIHRQDTTPEQLSSLYWLNLAFGSLIFVIIWLLAPVTMYFYQEPILPRLLRVTSVTFVITGLYKQFEILLLKNLEFSFLAKQQVISVLFGTVVAVITALMGYGVWALVWDLLAQTGLHAALIIRAGWRRYRPKLHFTWSDLEHYLSFGLYQMGDRTMDFLRNRLDQLMIGGLVDLRSLGYYNFAFRLVEQPMSRIGPIVRKVALPVFAQVQNDPLRLQRGYLQIVALLTSLNAVMLIGFIFIAPQAIPLIFGPKWADSIILAQILAVVALLRSITAPSGSLMLAKGRADLSFRFNLIILWLMPLTVYIGARNNGALGVAVALLVAQILIQVLEYLFFIRPLIGHCAGLYIRTITKPVVLATVMGLGVWLVSLISPPGWVGLIIQLVTGSVLSVGLWGLFDRDQMVELLSLGLGSQSSLVKAIRQHKQVPAFLKR